MWLFTPIASLIHGRVYHAADAAVASLQYSKQV